MVSIEESSTSRDGIKRAVAVASYAQNCHKRGLQSLSLFPGPDCSHIARRLRAHPGRTDESERCLLSIDAVVIWVRGRDVSSEGDLLRLTESMIDEKAGVIIPDGGRKKTGARHIARLTKRRREILEEIRAERRSGAAVPNVSGLVFTDQGRQAN